MTRLEAIDRAYEIWEVTPIDARTRPDGGADLLFAATVLGNTYHRLDNAQRPVCHSACRNLITAPPIK